MRHPWKQFHWRFLRPQGLFALSNPRITHGSSFVDNFWVGSDLVFNVDFWVCRGCLCCRIHASPVEAVSLMISESPGAVCAVESMRHPWKLFRWWFLSQEWISFQWWFLSPQGLFALLNPCVTRWSSFVDDFWVHKGCLRCRIHVLPLEAVLLMNSESTGDVCAVESMCHLWKQFHWWFLSRKRLRFRW